MSHPGPSKQTRERMDEVRAIIKGEGWSDAVSSHLSEEWGVARRQVRRIRLMALKELKAEADEDAAEGVVALEFLADVERHTRRASEDGAHGPVSSLLKIRQTVLGVEKAPQEQQPVSSEDEVAVVALALSEDAEFAAAVREAMRERGAWEGFVSPAQPD